jgi:hypothetical protein
MNYTLNSVVEPKVQQDYYHIQPLDNIPTQLHPPHILTMHLPQDPS